MPTGFQSPFRQLGTRLQPFGPPTKTKAPAVTPSAQGRAPTGYGTATGLYGPAYGMPASVGAAPQYGQFTQKSFEVPGTMTFGDVGGAVGRDIGGSLLEIAGKPRRTALEVENPMAGISMDIMRGYNAGEYDTQEAVDRLVTAGIITQEQADTTLSDYNTALSEYTQQSVQAQEAFDVQRGVQRRNILQQARLGEKDIFQYGRGDLFDQAVEAAYRGL